MLVIKNYMNFFNKNCIALFTVSKPHDEKSDAHKQDLLRACALKLQCSIVAFLAIPEAARLKHLQHALSLITKLDVSVIIIESASTLALPSLDLEQIFDFLAAHEISLAPADAACLDAEHLKMMLGFLKMSREAEKKLHAKRIKKSLLAQKKLGKKLGAKNFGEREDEKIIINQILELYSQGMNLPKICELLSVKNIKSMHQKKWHPTTLKRIIERHSSSAED